jgi:DNA invertase Pin-like site-specific DNA recombinase
VEDVGISGATLARPGFQRLRHAVATQEIDVIVVYHTDRISRSVPDFLNFLELLKKHGVRLVSVTQKLDFTGAMGEFNTIVQAAMQQFERKRTAERTSDTMMEHAREGMYNGGHLPIGYDAVKQALVVVEAEAAVVRRIFTAAADQVPLQQIADALNRDGHRTKIRFCKKKVPNSKVRIKVQRGGLKFRTDHLELIIRNPTYKGFVRWRGEVNKGKHQAIIDPELWERANSNPSRTEAGSISSSAEGYRLLRSLWGEPDPALEREKGSVRSPVQVLRMFAPLPGGSPSR